MYLLLNVLKLCCSLLCFFTVSELVASPSSGILSAQNAIIFIKKDPGSKIKQPVIIEISPGETIFFDGNQIEMVCGQGEVSSEVFCFSSGDPVYVFFRKGDDVRCPNIVNANDYYVFNFIDHLQEIVSDGDFSEEDEILQTLVNAHPVIHVYDDDQWVVVADNHVLEFLVDSKQDEEATYLSTVFAHTKWSGGISDQMVSYVKHQTHKLGGGGKANQRCYRDAEISDDDFIIIEPVCKKETYLKPLSDQEFFSRWTSWTLATIKPKDNVPAAKPKDNVPAALSHLTIEDSITDTHLFGGGGVSGDHSPIQVARNGTLLHRTHCQAEHDLPRPVIFCPDTSVQVGTAPAVGRKNNQQSAFTRQVLGVQAQQVEERDSSKHFPVQIAAEHRRSRDCTSKNKGSYGYRDQRVSTHKALTKSHRSHKHSQDLLIANPLSNHDLQEIVGKLRPLSPQDTLVLRGKKYTKTHYINRGAEGVVSLGVDENGQYVAIKSIFKPAAYHREPIECRETALLKSKQLEHPFAVRVIDVCQVGDFEYQIMPYLPRTMSEVRNNQKDWPVEKSWLVLRQLLTVVSCYHKNSITNRDIKPGNILISSDGASIQMSDFGTAKKVSPSGMSQSIIGTFEFMTPAHVLAYQHKKLLVNHFSSDLAAVALTIICMEINQTIFNRSHDMKKLTNNDLMSMLGHELDQFGWSDISSAKEIKTRLEKLFKDNCRVADDRLLELLAEMLTASSAGQGMASQLLADYFPDEALKVKDRKIVEVPYQKIRSFFNKSGVVVENVRADGNCLYSALALSMKRNLSDDEYSYILLRMPRVEGEVSNLVTSSRLRCYLHNLLSRILSVIDEVNDTDKREMYRQQLTSMLGEEYQLLKTMVTAGHILFAAKNSKQTQFWGDGSMVSTLLVLGFNLRMNMKMMTGADPDLASFSGLQQMFPDLIELLQINSSIPTHYRSYGWGRPLMLIYAEGNHYLAAYPAKESKKALELH
ncbi:MAG: hypothetical protein QS748_06240 [Candidatus Endonucleobacter bathymodioli]|uniref:Protein kinase domain-containing protein n=1 Tax=Candidatus Endonucleibacter bathymodioli TaxID=539814 RepID=A0AA90NT77_9GAMM|nr:hypothetical protein [Candidatus Endonucleobacter bathymodioli]